jgi:hypothetical protein
MYLRSSDFVAPNETLDPNAFIDPHDLAELKRLAGIPVSEDVDQQNPMAPAGQNPWGIKSPVGTTGGNINKRKIEKEMDLKPGDDDWFRLWFSKDADMTVDDFEKDEATGQENVNTLMSAQPAEVKGVANEAEKEDPVNTITRLAGMTVYKPK